MKYIIKTQECGYLFKNGILKKLLFAGKHQVFGLLGEKLVVTEMTGKVDTVGLPVEVLMENPQFRERVIRVQIPDDCIGLHLVNGVYKQVLTEGEALYWNVFEKNEIAYLKPHYYGGIRKYQWSAVPLAMHGVVVKADGEAVTVSIGEEPGDPQFCITDLLPHLSAEQNGRKLGEGIKGEDLNIVVGSIPFIGEEDEKIKAPVKLMAMKLLHEKYGITEKDFTRAEIEMVPAYKAVDIGLDRSLVGAYGQDDRVCAYTALMAEMETKAPAHTTFTVLADKEEVGSSGNTGLDSDFLLHMIEDLAEVMGAHCNTVLRHSICLSSDVNAAYDPTFAFVYEERNACHINKGCVLTKYTGARGKSGTNDASAETMAEVIRIMDENGVYWQTGELGAVDVGGGGTIAKFAASMEMDVVDLGVPILSMHAPFELASKLDVYNTYRAFHAFYR